MYRYGPRHEDPESSRGGLARECLAVGRLPRGGRRCPDAGGVGGLGGQAEVVEGPDEGGEPHAEGAPRHHRAELLGGRGQEAADGADGVGELPRRADGVGEDAAEVAGDGADGALERADLAPPDVRRGVDLLDRHRVLPGQREGTGQARVPGAAGLWRDLTDNVNQLAANLTNQVRSIADVATSVTKGDLTRSIAVEASGEMAALKDTINEMIRNLKEQTLKNAEQDWLKTNLARFSRMLQGERDLTTVSNLIMSELAPLVNAQYGVF